MLEIFILINFAIMIYHPFLTGYSFGAPDSTYYQELLLDAISQYKFGIFPLYLSKSQFLPDGTIVSSAPWFQSFGALIELVSSINNTIQIQHLTIFFSVLMSLVFVYLILKNIGVSSKLLQIIFPLLYICCPGVASLIYQLSMYASFVAIPFIPLLIYSQYKIDNSLDIKWAFLSSFALAMVWLSHAPTAFFLTIFCIFSSIFTLIKNIQKIKVILTFWVLFGLSFLWQFITMVYFGVSNSFDTSFKDRWYAEIINQLTSLYPDVFLPIGTGGVNYASFQLGYFLWFLYLINIICLSINKKKNWTNFVTIFTGILLLYLYPIKGISDWLWYYTPSIVMAMNPVWPNFRFYPMISILILVPFFLNFQEFNFNKYKSKHMHTLVFVLLFFWTLYQFYKTIENTDTYKYNSSYIDRIWDKKTFFHFDYGNNYDSRVGFQTYDPNLRFRMLDKNLNPINKLDNLNYILDKCLMDSGKSRFVEDTKILNKSILKPGTYEISKQIIQGKINYLFCMQLDGPVESDLFIWAGRPNEPPNARVHLVGGKSMQSQIFSLPLYLPTIGSQEMIISLNNNSNINVKKIGLIPYSVNELPIRVESFLPFKINFEPQNFNMFFESFMLFNKNYVANINLRKVSPLYIPMRSMLVPIDEGDSSLELIFKPPSFLFYIFLLSFFTILISILYFLIQSCITITINRSK